MIDTKELQVTAGRIEGVFDLGEAYAKAIRMLDPRLGTIRDDDLAVAFDVREGIDAAAFQTLGFKKAILTNSPSGAFEVFFPAVAKHERGVFQKVQERLPSSYTFSNLEITDFLKRRSFSPRLITMLKMAPQYFRKVNGDPTYSLMQMVEIHKQLKPKGTLIFSALKSDDNTEDAFRITGERLTSKNVSNEVLVDSEIPLVVQHLGTVILTIRK